MPDAKRVVNRLFTAIESRDLRQIGQALADDATWQNVPHAAVVGRAEVVALLAPIVTWSDRVRWEIISEAYEDDTAWVERVDRFWIGGAEHAVKCNGVFRVDPDTETVIEVRDYVDLGEWRSEMIPVYVAMGARPATEVVGRHVAGVLSGSVAAMAADYAFDATLERSGQSRDGWHAIANYFDTVSARLEGSKLDFGRITSAAPGEAIVSWEIVDGTSVVASGTDKFEVIDGRITRQVVQLDNSDF